MKRQTQTKYKNCTEYHNETIADNTREKLWARVCDITGEGMNKGYILGDCTNIKYEKDLIIELRKWKETDQSDEELLNEAYENDAYYWTEWECPSDISYIEDSEGNITDIELSQGEIEHRIIEDQKIKISSVPIHQDNPHRELKERVRELLELIEHNTTSLWYDNLECTTDCIVLEDVNSKEMRNEEVFETMKDDECYNDEREENKCKDNYQFTGSKINKLINDLKDLI